MVENAETLRQLLVDTPALPTWDTKMIYLVFALLVEAPDVKSYEVMRRPYVYDQQSTRVCGAIRRMRSPGIPFIIEADGPMGRKGLLVDAQIVKASDVGSGWKTCVRGIVRRVDGLSEKQAVAAGKTYILEDSSYDATYYLTLS